MTDYYKMGFCRLLIFFILAYSVGLSFAQEPEPEFEQIMATNLADIELGYALDTRCGIYSPNGTLMAVSGDGLYDLVTGQRRFETSDREGYYPDFSPDSQLLAADSDGMYDTNTGERLLEFEGKSPFFSPDGHLLAVSEDGVYDVQTYQRVLQIAQQYGPYPNPIFSPDGSLLAGTRDAVYDLETRQKLYNTSGFYLSFSPDSSLFITDEGVYDARTGNLLIELCSACQAVVSPSGSFLAISGDGLYELPNLHKRFSIGHHDSAFYTMVFSPDESIIVSDAAYDVSTGEQLAPISIPGFFSQDGSLFAAGWDHLYRVSDWEEIVSLERHADFGLDDSVVVVLGEGFYNASDGTPYESVVPGYTQFNSSDTLIMVENHWESGRTAERVTYFCLIYGMPGSNWHYRSGLAHVNERTNLRSAPNLNSAIVTTTSNTYLPIFATSANREWYRVGDNLWIAANAVQTVSLPEGIPVEEP